MLSNGIDWILFAGERITVNDEFHLSFKQTLRNASVLYDRILSREKHWIQYAL